MKTAINSVSQAVACAALVKSIEQHWPQYGNVQVRYQLIAIELLYSVISIVAESRLEKSIRVVEDFKKAGISPFLPTVYAQSDKIDSVGFGPLVERNGQHFILLDGVHRSLGAYVRGLKQIYVATIETQYVLPPVGALCQLVAVKSSSSSETQRPLFDGRGLVNFRPSALFTQSAEKAIMARMKGKLR